MATLTRYRPFQPARTLQREIDRLFGEYLPMFSEDEVATAVWAPALDMKETDAEYIVKMEVPGIPKEQITVNLEDHRLTVSGERKEEKKEENENRLVVERSYGSFFRSLTLPKAAADRNVTAEMKDGMLTIRVQKAEESKPRKIEIK